VIRRELEVSGVDESTVFPDLDGLGRTLTRKWLESTPPRKIVNVLPHEHVYTRLRPSRRHGVGVFAIQRIPKGTRIFEGDDEDLRWIPRRSLRRLPSELQRLYDDFAVLKDGKYGCPRNFSLMTVAWYLNESKKPNVRCDSNYDFFAARDIRAGEELTVDYSTYSEPQPTRTFTDTA
jgi:SET domain-containing protein